LVGLLGAHPSLGQDVAHGASKGLEAFARSGGHGSEDAVEDEMALVEPIGGPPEPNPAPAALRQKNGGPLGGPRPPADGHRFRLTQLIALPFVPKTSPLAALSMWRFSTVPLTGRDGSYS